MPARRFFTEGVRATGDRVDIGGSDAHKIVRVLRLAPGDAIDVVDSSGAVFSASIESATANGVRAILGERLKDDSPGGARLSIDLAQAVPKGAKMDFIVEKATELGVAAILPFYCERTIVRDVGASKIERWRRLAKTAAQQCGRAAIPPVENAIESFEALVERFASYDAVLFPWELAPQVPLLESLPPLLERASRVLVVIGPEGGFSREEAEKAVERGAALLSLGRRIVRTETAALVLLVAIGIFATS